jgi:hypothetical protein
MFCVLKALTLQAGTALTYVTHVSGITLEYQHGISNSN